MEVLYEQFIRERQYLLNVSEKTVDAYRWAWKAFEPALKGKSSVAKADLLQRISELRAEGLCAVTVNTYLRSVNAFCHWMVQEGHPSPHLLRRHGEAKPPRTMHQARKNPRIPNRRYLLSVTEMR